MRTPQELLQELESRGGSATIEGDLIRLLFPDDETGNDLRDEIKSNKSTLIEIIRVKESNLRALRDLVFGKRSSDSEWESVKKNWMRPNSQRWLEERSKVRLP